jgi:signal transduction histidine kinase
LFLYRKNERVYLLFSLFCLTTAVRFFLEINALGVMFLPGGVSAVLHRVYMSSMVIQAAIILIFTHTVFGMTYGGKGRRKLRIAPLAGVVVLIAAAVFIVVQDKLSIGYSVLCLAAACMLFGLSYGGSARRVFYWTPLAVALVHSLFIPFTVVEGQWIGISVLPLALTIIFAIKEKKVRLNQYNTLYLLSMVVFILWEPVTKIILLDHNFAATVASNLFFIISQSIMLAVGYAELKRRAEEFSAKTDFYRRMSHELLTPLTKVSTNIQVADTVEDTDHERLAKSQEEIMKMAGMINHALSDSNEEEGSVSRGEPQV